MLEEVVDLNPDVRRVLSYPNQAFGTDNREVLESKLTKWCHKTIPKEAPQYVHRLYIANIMSAQGNDMGACRQTEFARAEAAEPTFGKLLAASDPKATEILFNAQRWQIDVLLSIWSGGTKTQTDES